MSSSKRWFWISLGLVCSAPSIAFAGNGLHPRTPVLWEDVPCMSFIDRSQNAVWHLPYDIPFEDTDVTPDEVTDSRRHQFIAYCRRKNPQQFLPNWITWADVEDAAAVGLVDADAFTDEDVLEVSPDWTDCWFRITGDDERRPITFAMADEGVDWDTTNLDPGAYTIYGYTYEPAFNLWKLRPGVVKIHDGDPDAVGPAAAITTTEQIIYNGDTTTIEGCVDAIDGATYTAYWARTEAQPEWVPFLENQSVEGETFAIDFTAPEEIVGEESMIRIDFDDPQGRSYTAFMEELVIVLPGSNPNGCDETGGSFVGDPGCGTGDGGTTGDGGASTTGVTTDSAGTTGGGSDSTGPGETDGPPARGCGCSTPTHSAGGVGALAMVALLGLRRRRR